jgi:Lrp/AsnC family transcriptional regulator for asnA, asnC and gidA
MTPESLDDLDRAILRQLEDDGRRAFREIARTVGTSEATVRARVKRMQDLEILRIVAFADPERLGNQQLALLLITVDPNRHSDVVAELTALPEISYVSTLLGRADICAEVASANNVELWNFLNTHVNTIDGVRSIEPMSVLHVHKLRYGSPAVD